MLPWKNTLLANIKELLLELQPQRNQKKKRRNNQHTPPKSSQTPLLKKQQSSLPQRSLKQQKLRQLKQYLPATLNKLSQQRLRDLPKCKLMLMVHSRTLMLLQRSSQELPPRSALLTEAERQDRMSPRRESKEHQQQPPRSSEHLQKKPRLKSQPRAKSRKQPPPTTPQLMMAPKPSPQRLPLQATPPKLTLTQPRSNLLSECSFLVDYLLYID